MKQYEKSAIQTSPGASRYLYNLAAGYYRFEDYNEAVVYFLEATHYSFYEPWVELNTYTHSSAASTSAFHKCKAKELRTMTR